MSYAVGHGPATDLLFRCVMSSLWVLIICDYIVAFCYSTIVRWAAISVAFVGNVSVSTFPWQRLRIQRGKRGVIYAVHAEDLKRRESGQSVKLSSAREAEKRWGYSWVDSWQDFCTGDCDKRAWGREAKESALLEAVARQRQQAGRGLAGAVVICELWRLAVAL
jgi:hypothetical protein